MPLLAAGGSLDPRGPAAREILDLTWILTGLGVAVFVVFAAALAASFRRPAPGSGGGPRKVEPGPAALRWIVAGGVVMPCAVLLVTFGFTAEAMRDTPGRAPAGSLRIDVIGHQWWYEVRYPDHGFSTANEIHIPAGRPVELHLTSADVIHSFWVPTLAGKLDMLPDYENVLVIAADKPGEYRGACAEFCGLQHALMRLVVVAEDPARFSEWLAGQQRPAAEPQHATARRGRDVFAGAGCGDCHTIARHTAAGATAPSAPGERGPDLTHLASRQRLAAGTLTNTARHLTRWLTDPQEVKEGTQMRALDDLSEEQIADLVAYMEFLE